MADFSRRARGEIKRFVRKAKYDSTHPEPTGPGTAIVWQQKRLRFINDAGLGTIPAGGVFVPTRIDISESGQPTIHAGRAEDFPVLIACINSIVAVESTKEGYCSLATDFPVKAAYDGGVEIGDMCGVPPDEYTLQYGYPGFRCWGFSEDDFLMAVRDSHVPPYWGVLDVDLEEGGEAQVSIWITDFESGEGVDSEIDVTAYDWLMAPVEGAVEEEEEEEEDLDKICAGSKVKIELFGDGYWYVTNSACDDAECEEDEPEE